MSDIATIMAIGRATKEGVLSYSEKGTAILRFGLAVNRSVPPRGEEGWKNIATFYEVEAFGKLAEAKQAHVTKGRTIAVSGSLQPERWEKDGSEGMRLRIVATEIQILGESARPAPAEPEEGDQGVMATPRRIGSANQAAGWPERVPGRKADAPHPRSDDFIF